VLSIAGTGRNGATILGRMLAQVPGVVAVGELGYLWERGLLLNQECGCGSPVRECPFWIRVGDEAFGGWDSVKPERVVALQRQVQRERYLPLLASRRLSRAVSHSFDANLYAYTHFMARLYDGILRAAGADVVVDGMKEVPYVYLQPRVPGIDLRILHLVRDSRGVAYSWTKHVERGVSVGEREVLRRPPSRSARRWVGVNAMFHVLARTGVPTTFMTYESVIRSPRERIVEILSFAGVDFSSDDLDFISGNRSVDLGVTHTVEGSRTRFEAGPVPLRVDDEWRTRMSPGDRRLVTAMTWPLLARYGYGTSEEPEPGDRVDIPEPSTPASGAAAPSGRANRPA
jgi:Sulfotransferase domain